jgi:hypothetical protein
MQRSIFQFWIVNYGQLLPVIFRMGVKQLARVSNSSCTILQSSLNSQTTVFYDIDIWWLRPPYEVLKVSCFSLYKIQRPPYEVLKVSCFSLYKIQRPPYEVLKVSCFSL